VTGDRRGRRGDAPLPGPWQLRDRLLAGLEVADSGTWTATHALPQRTVPARTGDNVVLSAGVDGAPGTLTYTLLVGRHPGLDPGLARAALARAESPAGRRGSSNPRRYALVGDGTCWDDGGWSHWLAAGAGGGGRYRLYRRPVGTARSGTAPELLATMAAAGLEAAVRDAVSGALRDGIALARLDAARDWRPLTPRVGGGRDGLADRVDVARQDAEAAARDLANAQADLRAAAGVAGSARAALVGNLTEAGRALDVASRRHGDLLAQVAARGPGGEPPDEFGCELDLLLAGLRLLGSGQPQAVRAVGALHDVLRLRLDPGDGAVAFAARVRVLADDGLVADLGPVLAEVPNRAHATGTRAGTGRRSRAEASRDNAERRARGRDRLDPAATERMMLTDDGPGELAALFRADRPGVGRPLGTGLRRRVLAHLAELGLHPRACRLVLDDPVQENRAEVWSALTGGPRAGGAYADWVVALYTAPGPPPGADPGGHSPPAPGVPRAGHPRRPGVPGGRRPSAGPAPAAPAAHRRAAGRAPAPPTEPVAPHSPGRAARAGPGVRGDTHHEAVGVRPGGPAAGPRRRLAPDAAAGPDRVAAPAAPLPPRRLRPGDARDGPVTDRDGHRGGPVPGLPKDARRGQPPVARGAPAGVAARGVGGVAAATPARRARKPPAFQQVSRLTVGGGDPPRPPGCRPCSRPAPLAGRNAGRGSAAWGACPHTDVGRSCDELQVVGPHGRGHVGRESRSRLPVA